MVAIIDYNAGNLKSVEKALAAVGKCDYERFSDNPLC